jgi:pSer/pThr/pTyr-binding forkhead associated (FHA) protein
MKVKVSHSPDLDESQELDLSLATKKGGYWTIGRSPDADLVLNHADISRLHGKFFFQGGNFYFSDLGSRNGSIINSKLAEKNQAYILNDGDIIRIGDFVLEIEEVISYSEQAPTVMRIITPGQIANKRFNPQADNSNVDTNKAPSLVNEFTDKAGDEVVDKVDKEDVNFIDIHNEDELLPKVALNLLENSREISDVPLETEKVEEVDNSETPVVSEIIPEIKGNLNFTYIQPCDNDQFPEDTTLEDEVSKNTTPENTIPENINESVELLNEVAEEVNIESSINVEDSVNDITPQITELLDYTIVQPHDITDEVSGEMNSSDEHQEEQLEASFVQENTPSSEKEELNTSLNTINVEDSERAEAFIENSPNELTEELKELEEEELEKHPESITQNISQKRIVLIAHESKKSELSYDDTRILILPVLLDNLLYSGSCVLFNDCFFKISDILFIVL